jgi:hypothetical protein
MKKILFLSVLCALTFLAGCEEGDGDKELGLQFIYMPQATVSGGLNNYYDVPSGNGRLTYNFTYDETGNRLDVHLGVLLSGTAPSDGFTVDVNPLISHTQSLIDEGAIDGALLPAASYSLPGIVRVEQGETAASFELSIHMETINDAANTGKVLLLEVGISNPSAYELAASNTSTLVLIHVDAIREIIEEY